MRYKFYLLLTVLVFSYVSSYGQWMNLNPYPQANDVYDIAIPEPNKLVGVTNWISDVIVSTDGGSAWDIININSSRNFRSLSFPNPSTGYMVGGGPDTKPWKTTDGG